MFGDLFSTKTDLQLGLLYSSRRKFLVSAGKNSLEPPQDFKTKRQARRQIQNHCNYGDLLATAVEEYHEQRPKRRESVQYGKDIPTGGNIGAGSNLNSNARLLGLLNPLKKSISEGTNGKGASMPLRNFRKTAKFVMEAVIIEHYWEGNRDDWAEEDMAGVHYYVNKITGEVTTDCPWRPKHGTAKNKLLSKQPSFKSMAVDSAAEEGTGSLVYDNTEVEELFSLLDELDKKKESPIKAQDSSPSKSISPVKSAAMNIIGNNGRSRT